MNTAIFSKLVHCRVCQSSKLSILLDLGWHYLPNWNTTGQGDRAPLHLVRCQQCGLVQLLHSANRDSLYEHYWFRSDGNRSSVAILEDVAKASLERVKLNPGDTVLDIGGNVGTLLNILPGGLMKVNVDPAGNLLEESKRSGHITVQDYFSADAYWKAVGMGKKAKLVTCVAMFYDLEDPVAFCRDVAEILDDDGLFVVQQNYLLAMLQNQTFDNIGAEHLLYLSLKDMVSIASSAGLKIVGTEEVAVLGGSFRVFMKKDSGEGWRSEELATALRKEEREAEGYLRSFSQRCSEVKSTVVGFIRRASGEGKKVYIYGSSTRGLTILQYFGLTSEDCPYAVERNPEKIGKRVAGLGIPIISEEEARYNNPDYMLVLPYFYTDEFINREEDWLKGGGQFIVPLPRPLLITRDGWLPLKKSLVEGAL